MDKNNHIQQLINSRKLSTNEEYELFEGITGVTYEHID